MFLNIKFFISNVLYKYKKNIVSVLIFSIGVIFVSLLSGASFTTFGMSSKMKIVLYASSFFYFLALFVFNIRISDLKRLIKEKRIQQPSWLTIAYILMFSFSVLSFLFNRNKSDNVNTYISFVITISLTYFILMRFDKTFILKVFKNILCILCVASSTIFLITLVSNTFFSPLSYSSGEIIFGNHFFLNTDFISGLTYSFKWKLRLSSFFWEPSVLGAMIICGLFADLFTKDRFTIFRTIIFIFCIILSSSTTAYVLVLFYFFAIGINALKNHERIQITVFVIAILGLLFLVLFLEQTLAFLANILPSVFGKFVDSSSIVSFTTRLYSFKFYFEVFLKNPVFGLGGVTANELYKNLAGDLATSGTSTFGLIIASLGIAGIFYIVFIFIGIFFNSKLELKDKLLLAIVILLMSNAQGQSAILVINILYFMPLCFVQTKKQQIQQQTEDKRLSDIIFSKNENGELSMNLIFSMIIKGISIVLAFFTVPTYLKYFNYNNSTYGVWLTITSILALVTVFDFGMGNGLKNALIKNINDKNYNLSKKYVSTTYVLTGIIGIIISIVPTIIIYSISNNLILNIFFTNQPLSESEISSFRLGISIIMFAIGGQFVLKNINYILQAHQKNAISSSFMLITNLCLLLFAAIFSNYINSSSKIVALSIAYFVLLNGPLIIASIVLFSSKYKKYAPNLKYVDFRNSKIVVSTGLKFFIVQIGSLIMWSANEFIILFVFKDSSLVTTYSEYYRLFSLFPIILGTVVQQPIWTAISRADIRKDTKKVIQYMKVLFAITALILLLNIILDVSIAVVFKIWLGENAPQVTYIQQIVFAIYSLIYIVAMCIVIICNSMSLFKAQIISAVLAIALKIPLMIAFSHLPYFGMSWEATILINMFCYLPVLIYAPFEIKKYLKTNHGSTFSQSLKKKKEVNYTEINI